MSTKSTVLLTPCCHIYKDYTQNHTQYLETYTDEYVLVIDVSYGNIYDGEEQDCIVVDWNSDFAAMIRFMVRTCGADVIDEFVTTYHKNKEVMGD